MLSCFRSVSANCRGALERRYHAFERKRARSHSTLRSSVGMGLLCASDMLSRALASYRTHMQTVQHKATVQSSASKMRLIALTKTEI